MTGRFTDWKPTMTLPTAPRRALLACSAVALVLAACGKSASSPDLYDVSAAPARYRAVAETFAREARGVPVNGAVLGIIEGGELAYAVGVGARDPRAPARVGPDTLFRIGSITKMMTALAVLQEVQAGRVALDDTVVSHVPGFHLAGDDVSAVTVRELLEHATGLVDYLELNAPTSERDDGALARFLTGRFAQAGYLMSPPGAFYNYSNPGYMLAGLVAETTSGVPYRTLLDQRVLEPLGMSRTLFVADDVLADGDFAVGRNSEAGLPPYIEPGTYDNPWARPAGYAWSSVPDLARFARFLLAGDAAVLDPALHAVMTHPARETQELLDLIHYGFGLQQGSGFFLGGSYYAAPTLFHTGAIPGFSASMFLVPELGFGVITLASGDGASFGETLAAALAALPTLPAPSAAPDLAPDPSTFGEEVGVYHDPHLAGAVTVSLVNGGLRIAIPAADQTGLTYDPALVPLSPRSFLLTIDGTPLQLTFLHPGAGQPTWLRTRLFVAERPAQAAVAPAAPAPAGDPARLRAAVAQVRSVR